jgi:hypothetical protein
MKNKSHQQLNAAKLKNQLVAKFNFCLTATVLAILIWFNLAAKAEDLGIHTYTDSKTNSETKSIYKTEVFLRDGQTNLVRKTKIKAEVVQGTIQRFYHGGILIGDYVSMNDSSGFTTEADIPFSVSFEFWPSKDIRSAVIGTKDGQILDAFSCTNGLFFPCETSMINKANGITKDLSKLLSPTHVTNTTPEKFGKEVEAFIQKHKDK